MARPPRPPVSKTRHLLAAVVAALAFGFLLEGFDKVVDNHHFDVGEALFNAAFWGVGMAAFRWYDGRNAETDRV